MQTSALTQRMPAGPRKGRPAGDIGGDANNISGSFSAVLGGQGNNDSGLNDVFIAGSGIAAVNPASLHVNGLWANGIPGPGPGGALLGTVFFAVMPFLPAPFNTYKFLAIV
jgi:hypothetical protein